MSAGLSDLTGVFSQDRRRRIHKTQLSLEVALTSSKLGPSFDGSVKVPLSDISTRGISSAARISTRRLQLVRSPGQFGSSKL